MTFFFFPNEYILYLYITFRLQGWTPGPHLEKTKLNRKWMNGLIDGYKGNLWRVIKLTSRYIYVLLVEADQ